ncbi:malate synthase [Asanoa ishikariensis]|uniref:Malate synthase n=1 Tax=Asanoa ishikariensis TaxID=137265 RepID=A0A1H3TVR4_9ACTN|nr:malate synthase A [Asanoa ishikariensis]GIF67575.1 malate synthase [Asanoa ishikariensis]SDZ54286.1 malate synthase [Asanoa ishikariensis]
MTLRAVDHPDLSERGRAEILSAEALDFLGALHDRFDARRRELVAARRSRPAPADFVAETADVRSGDWRVVPPRPDYADRRVEITGPTDRKLVINALNSGAKGFMADFEDANSPTWSNQVEGQANLVDAVRGTITYESSDGRHYALRERTATLMIRPRGWHLPEKHLVSADGTTASGSLVDFGLFAFHNAQALLDRGKAPYLYLPKMEHHLEARLWNEVFVFTQEALGLPHGTFRATVLIETLPAAFQMEEILFELRDHSYGLNAGRWDYIFSMIKSYRDNPAFVLPDRLSVTMTAPFMRAYTELLVATCHRRGAFAMGGMAALIPSRTDAAANERAIDAVRADKRREAGAGFDGTWVAHPDLVPVATAEFDAVLGERANQIDRQRDDVTAKAGDLLDAAATPGAITEAGLRNDVSVGFRYISFWLSGRGAAGINNMMEDAATAEIARSQLWQWIRHGVTLDDGRQVTRELVAAVLDEEMATIRAEVGDDVWHKGRPDETRAVFTAVTLGDTMPEFLTIDAYEIL